MKRIPIRWLLGWMVGLAAYSCLAMEEQETKIEKEHGGEARLSVPLVAQGYEEIYQRFLNGRLIYKPNEDNDIGKVELRIADLMNPLDGTFDLSKCGDTGKYLSISTGYGKGTKKENANKFEIWFTPRFLVEKEINGSASHFKQIFPDNWPNSSPVGIFWNWGSWGDRDLYDYLTTENMDNLSKIDLYKGWEKAARRGSLGMAIGYEAIDKFIVPHAITSCFVCDLK